jgi:hypothetical protein
MSLTLATQQVIAPITATGTTTPRLLQNRFADVVNVKDFGAVGDGVTDDTAAIQAAMSSSLNVFYPNGLYFVNQNLTLTGKHIFQGGTIFINSGSTLYLNCSIDAGYQVCFSGTGNILFSQIGGVWQQGLSANNYNPIWFGAKPNSYNYIATGNSGSNIVTLNTINGIEQGVGFCIDQAGNSPLPPTNVSIVANSTGSTTYSVRISSISSKAGVSISSSNVTITNGASSPNNTITFTLSTSTDVVAYAIYVNNSIVGYVPSTSSSYTNNSTTPLTFQIHPNVPTSPTNTNIAGMFVSIVKSIDKTNNKIVLSDNLIVSVNSINSRIDSTVGLNFVGNICRSSYDQGQDKCNTIKLESGSYNLSGNVIVGGLFNIIGSGNSWISGTVITQHAVLTNNLTILGATFNDGISVGCTLRDFQLKQFNRYYPFDNGNSYSLYVPTNGGYGNLNANSIYFYNVRFNTILGLNVSHGDDWIIDGCCFDGGLKQIVQGNNVSLKWTNVRISNNNFFQPQQNAIVLNSGQSVNITDNSFNNVYPTSGSDSTSTAVAIYSSSGINLQSNNCNYIRRFCSFNSCYSCNISNNNFSNSAGEFIYFSGTSTNDFNITNNLVNFVSSAGSYYAINFDGVNSFQNFIITDNNFDLTNSTSNIAINSALTSGGSCLLSPIIKGNNQINCVLTNYCDASNSLEYTITKSLTSTLPTSAQTIVTLAPLILIGGSFEIHYTTFLNQSGVAAGFESGVATVLVAQAGGTSGAVSFVNITNNRLGMGFNGNSNQVPTTTFSYNAPSNTTAGNIQITISSGNGYTGSTTIVFNARIVANNGKYSSSSNTFSIK